MKLTGPSIEEAFRHFQRDEFVAAEATLTKMPNHSSALHLLAVLRVRQHRLPEAAELLSRSVALQPQEAQAHFNLAKVQSALGRDIEAVGSLRATLALDARMIDATLVLAKILQSLGRFDEAIEAYRQFLLARSSDVLTGLGLGKALIALGRLQEAEQPLLSALNDATEPRHRADLHQALAYAYRQKRPEAALSHLESAQALQSGPGGFEQERIELLEELQRFEDAKAAYREQLEREPVNANVHQAYSELLYRLGGKTNFLPLMTAHRGRKSSCLPRRNFYSVRTAMRRLNAATGRSPRAVPRAGKPAWAWALRWSKGASTRKQSRSWKSWRIAFRRAQSLLQSRRCPLPSR